MNDYVEVKGLDEIARRLNASLEPIIKAVAFVAATEAQDFISPYPTQPAPANPKRWYERGYGSKWRTKDGSIHGRKTSEVLGRKWSIRPYQNVGAVLQNTASYAPFVHSADNQATIHKNTGWKTDTQTADHIINEGIIERTATDLVAKLLGATT